MALITPSQPTIPSRRGEPCWEIAERFPEQGTWTERAYLALPDNRRLEFNGGMIEVLPVPTKTHQLVMMWFWQLLHAFVGGRGLVLVSGYKLRVASQEVQFREPDVIYLTPEQNAGSGELFTGAAELVAEVVSPNDPQRDYVTKRAAYAAGGVPEYWILDPVTRRILVLGLEGGQYVERGNDGSGQRAVSHHLPGFGVTVDDMLAQIQPQTADDDEAQ